MYVSTRQRGMGDAYGNLCSSWTRYVPAIYAYCFAVEHAPIAGSTGQDIVLANTAQGKLTPDQKDAIAQGEAGGLVRASGGKLSYSDALKVASGDVNTAVPDKNTATPPGKLAGYLFLGLLTVGGLWVATN